MWHQKFTSMLERHGLKRLVVEHSIYFKMKDGPQMITAWVDDLLGIRTQRKDTLEIREILESKFQITDLGEPRLLVGMEIR